MEGTMAVIATVAYNFAPQSWANCNGQLLAINQNQALFALLGTTFGGNGVTTFGLPDLRGRTMIGSGTLAGGSTYFLGQTAGAETNTILLSNLPSHTHNGSMQVTLKAHGVDGDSQSPQGAFPAAIPQGYNGTATPGVFMKTPDYSGSTVGIAGSNQPYSLRAPYLAVRHIICMFGIFPSRN